MKAILIDPHENTVDIVEYNGDHRHLNNLVDSDRFKKIKLDNKDVLYVNCRPVINKYTRYFSIEGKEFAGLGLILGDKESDVVHTVDYYKEAISMHSKIFQMK
jgi:hypothetical protein